MRDSVSETDHAVERILVFVNEDALDLSTPLGIKGREKLQNSF